MIPNNFFPFNSKTMFKIPSMKVDCKYYREFTLFPVFFLESNQGMDRFVWNLLEDLERTVKPNFVKIEQINTIYFVDIIFSIRTLITVTPNETNPIRVLFSGLVMSTNGPPMWSNGNIPAENCYILFI